MNIEEHQGINLSPLRLEAERNSKEAERFLASLEVDALQYRNLRSRSRSNERERAVNGYSNFDY